MKIQLVSDLHREMWYTKLIPFEITPADVLVLAGDIDTGRRNVKEFLKQMSDCYPHVIYIMGNHEAYGSSIAVFENLSALPDNVYFLNPGQVTIDNTKFVGACLWTDFNNQDFHTRQRASNGINDFSRIADATTQKYIDLHTRDITYIKANQDADVVITHFLPAQACIAPRFRSPDLINYYFANTLDNYIARQNHKLWLFGHTHDSVDIHINKTRLIANPYGYQKYNDINPEFSIQTIIEV